MSEIDISTSKGRLEYIAYHIGLASKRAAVFKRPVPGQISLELTFYLEGLSWRLKLEDRYSYFERVVRFDISRDEPQPCLIAYIKSWRGHKTEAGLDKLVCRIISNAGSYAETSVLFPMLGGRMIRRLYLERPLTTWLRERTFWWFNRMSLKDGQRAKNMLMRNMADKMVDKMAKRGRK